MTRRNSFFTLVPPIFIGSAGIALNGYDPVACFTLRQPAKGRPEFAHAGGTYHLLRRDGSQ